MADDSTTTPSTTTTTTTTTEYDPHFTDRVIAATGPAAHPRLKQIMPALLRHLHDFAREVDLTVAEWAAGVEMINEAGQMSTDKRNETQLLCDVLGLESLVDEITSKLLLRSGSGSGSGGAGVAATPSTVLGPFYRADAPVLPLGASIVREEETEAEATGQGQGKGLGRAWLAAAEPLRAHVSGRVLDAATGAPVAGALVDVWLAGPNGLYEQQDDEAPDMNLRGRFETDELGRYALYCLRPTAYPIPSDGPAGRLLRLLDRHPYRPAHVHFIVQGPPGGRRRYRPLTTQVFDRDDPRAGNGDNGGDAVFAVKDELLVGFRAREGDPRARWELEFDIRLVSV
ncbi:catechol 1,2-dioxygenase-like protein [Xylariaceae sp. FL0804]|nr:catechol 1,2-dioxygenase-like protein [Xylariaceae sp. FL0804]